MPRAVAVAGLLLAAALAGCTSGGEAPALATVAMGRIHGVVTDAGLHPLAGAAVRVDGTELAAATDATGAFAFDVPEGEYLVLATAEGHRGTAQRATALASSPAALSFALAPVPTERPSVEVSEGQGLLSCRALVEQGPERQEVSCGANDPNERPALAFPLGEAHGLEGVVVELSWTPSSAAASRMLLTVSAAGEEPVAIGHAEGAGHATLTLPARVLEPVLAAGGELVVSASPAGSLFDEEATLDAGVAMQQPFAVYVSVFRHAAPPAGYTVLDA